MIKISIIIPIRDEENYIKECIESIINFDYPKEALEILFIDGMSEDNTLDIIEQYQDKYPYIKVIENIKKIVPTAMNIGLKVAKGNYICRLDAHASYPTNYISKLLKWSQKLDADNVGAVCITKVKSNSYIARAIQFVMSDKFGVGNSLFRIGVKKEMEVDTVPFGFYKKDIFDKIGFYNENLVRAEDIELNKRLKRAGGKIYLVPNIECTYYPREEIVSFSKNRFQTGRWVILASYFTNSMKSISIRHLVPLFFTTSLLILTILSFIDIKYLMGLLYLLTIYSIILFFRVLKIKRDFILSVYILILYFILHFSYGIGSLKAFYEIIIEKIKGK